MHTGTQGPTIMFTIKLTSELSDIDSCRNYVNFDNLILRKGYIVHIVYLSVCMGPVYFHYEVSGPEGQKY